MQYVVRFLDCCFYGCRLWIQVKWNCWQLQSFLRLSWCCLLAQLWGFLFSLCWGEIHTEGSGLWSSLFIVQLSHAYEVTENTMARVRCVLVLKVTSLLFSTWNRSFAVDLPNAIRHLISWLLLPWSLIVDPGKIKSLITSIFSPFIMMLLLGPVVRIFVFFMLMCNP